MEFGSPGQDFVRGSSYLTELEKLVDLLCLEALGGVLRPQLGHGLLVDLVQGAHELYESLLLCDLELFPDELLHHPSVSYLYSRVGEPQLREDGHASVDYLGVRVHGGLSIDLQVPLVGPSVPPVLRLVVAPESAKG